MEEKRKDNRGRILRDGENQMKDGRYRYQYMDGRGKRCAVYSWKLVAILDKYIDTYNGHKFVLGGMKVISVEDMTDLIYMYDAYDDLNQALFGTRIVLGFYEGNFAVLNRVNRLIGRNVAEKLKENDYEAAWKILENRSIPPERRAQMLLMK